METVIDAQYVRTQLARRRDERLARLRKHGLRPSTAPAATWIGDLQQGDGGKGAMTDRLAAQHGVVVRVQGGDNAGHTTVFQSSDGSETVVKNHLIPSGLRHPNVIGVLANGVLINLERLESELTSFEEFAPGIGDRVFVSGRAHLILPLHRSVDDRQEAAREGTGSAIGTTRRGIGPANVCKVNRIGLRVHDLANANLIEKRIREAVQFFGLPQNEVERNVEWVRCYRDVALTREVDSARLIEDLVATNHSVLFEGAQGPLIDLEHGIYPYVTTSPTAVHSVGSGAGFHPHQIDHRIGVLKAYQTMVGNGAFVSEDSSDLGDRLRLEGGEFGTTTGRQRRCGWLDLVQARWAVEVNRFTSVAITKLDVLDTFEKIGVCVGYERDGDTLVEFDAEHESLERCRPIFRYFDGWLQPTTGTQTFERLPLEAREFIAFVEEQLSVEVGAVTVGPRDTDMLVRTGTSIDGLVAK